MLVGCAKPWSGLLFNQNQRQRHTLRRRLRQRQAACIYCGPHGINSKAPQVQIDMVGNISLASSGKITPVQLEKRSLRR